MICFALFVLALYLWVRVTLAHILAKKLTGEILHTTPSERPFLLVLIGLIFGRMPSQNNLSLELTSLLMRAGLIAMFGRYWKVHHAIHPGQPLARGHQ